ncbi:6520_t:CDS:2 [Ambispora gerdemannii]|uniref:6520_t:CDS:1 n=1 Tax=Ambispora gerdemannii TaxID=144530 RepID=A0A9N9A9X4_9GLOM|nr:6520_t:CDS:2 [Ambispora gerdemannii]
MDNRLDAYPQIQNMYNNNKSVLENESSKERGGATLSKLPGATSFRLCHLDVRPLSQGMLYMGADLEEDLTNYLIHLNKIYHIMELNGELISAEELGEKMERVLAEPMEVLVWGGSGKKRRHRRSKWNRNRLIL